jgi:hypothetical protein
MNTSNNDLKEVTNKLHLQAKIIRETGVQNREQIDRVTTYGPGLTNWLEFIGNNIIPSRIEQSVINSNLATDQADLSNKNSSIVNLQREQMSVIDRVITDFYNKGYTSLRNFQSTDYKLQNKEFQLEYIKYAFICIAFNSIIIGVSLLGYLNITIALVVAFVIGFIYLMMLFLEIRQNRSRMKYEWDKMYFKGPKKNTTCDN